MCELAAERVGVQVVRERTLAVDLDHRQPFAVTLLELGVAGDVDLLELELLLPPKLSQLRPRPLAEVALGRVEERDLRDRGRG